MDISGVAAEVHMRTDANNLVSTAKTTHLPEQKETIHMIQMMRMFLLGFKVVSLVLANLTYLILHFRSMLSKSVYRKQ